jgi:hypothetical protein
MSIAQFINRYSFLLIAVFILACAAFIVLRRGTRGQALLVVAGAAAILLIIWVGIHPRQTQQPGQTAAIEAKIGRGVPVLLEFQSPY